MIFEQQALWNYPKQTYGPMDSLVKEFQSQESKKASAKVLKMKKQMNVQTCFSRLLDCSLDFPKKIDLNGCSVKMSRIYYLLTEVSECSESCVVWTKQGMTANGKFSTLSTPILSERQLLVAYHKTGSVCTLSATNEELTQKVIFSL